MSDTREPQLSNNADVMPAVAFSHQAGGSQTTLGFDPDTDTTPALTTGQTVAVALSLRGREGGAMPELGDEIAPAMRTPGGGASVPMALTAGGNRPSARGGDLVIRSSVRRLTPLECERLQGFPDGYTAVIHRKKPAADGPRYKALGNSMAVPVMAWIGRRIAAVERPYLPRAFA